MSQHDYVIANQGAAAFRADLNNALDSVMTVNSGSTAPIDTAPAMLWYDTANGLLKQRNAADSGWVTIKAIGAGNLVSNVLTTKGDLFVYDGSAMQRIGAGTNNHVLTADSVQSLGIKWAAPSSGAWEYLGSSGAISAAATVDFTTAGWFASTYQALYFECIRVKPANDGVSLYLLASVDGGTNWLGASTYDYINNGRNSADAAKAGSAAAAARIIPHSVDTIGNDTNEWYSGEILLKNAFATVYKDVGWSSNHQGTGNVMQSSHGRGRVLTNSAINGIRFLMSAGNVASGEIKVYGLRAS